MARSVDHHNSTEVLRLLDGASRTIANARYCWLATASQSKDPRLRPMGRLPPEPGDDVWMIRFVTDGRSRKVSDIRRNGVVTLIFQHDADDAFVAVTGSALLREGESEIRRSWKSAYDPFFPTATDKANAAFLDIEAERMELWIRGVTPEPFGLRATTLERDAAGAWRRIA